MYGIGRKFKRYFGGLKFSGDGRELDRIAHQPKNTYGYTNILKKPFKFHHGPSFAVTYKEIFQDKIYQFNPSGKSRTIIDCGANMGLSVIYFSLTYPDHQIIAFEPDAEFFSVLEENVKSFGLKNVILHNKAVWDKEDTLTFYKDEGMGGRVENSYSGQQPTHIQTVRLKDFLSADVDFLKIDIEGAEDTVLNDCADRLSLANSIFFEYHNDINKPQSLHQLLSLVKEQGFHYYVKDSYTRRSPFQDKDLVCEAFDMAINVFCYKNSLS